MRRSLRVAAGLLVALTGLVQSPGSATAEDQPRRHALLVGVSRYQSPDLDLLRYPENDVVALRQVLRDAGFDSEEVRLLTLTNGEGDDDFVPTGANILRELQRLIARSKAGDTVVLAFSGHGVQYQGDDESYFCPADANLNDRSSLIAIGGVYSQLEQCQADVKLVFVDACRNELDSNTRAARSAKLEAKGITRTRLPPGGLAAFYSCSPGELAYEDVKLTNGVFFHFLVQGLKGQADLDSDKQVTLPELEQFVKRGTSTHVEGTFGARQMPELFNRTRGLTPLTRWDLPRPGWTSFQSETVGEWGEIPPGVPGPYYSFIRGLIPGSKVDLAGLKAGDVVLSIDGRDMDSSGDISETERTYPPGSIMQFVVLRGTETLTIPVESEPKPTEGEWFEAVQARAQAGETWAMVATAGHYSGGNGVQQDRRQAFEWYLKAAELGDADAQNYVGVLYDTGRGVPEDDRLAVDWYRKSAQQGHWWGAKNLGGMYAAGTGIAKDEAEAVKWYRIAAERGLAEAQNALGLMYDAGRGVPLDDVEGNRWYQRAADQGMAAAIYNLAYNAAAGEGCPQDLPRAHTLFRQAAAKDHVLSMYRLARMHDEGEGVEKSHTAALEWYRQAAAHQHAAACWYLGWASKSGDAVPQSDAEAFQWWLRGAERGDDDCRSVVALMYLDGSGVTRDAEAAVTWAKRVENQQDWKRCFVLATLHQSGEVLPQDLPEALRLFEVAAESGAERAIVPLALLYQTGQGGTVDLAAASRWFLRGAENGSSFCQYLYGLACKNGRGVAVDHTIARKWFQKAADQGDEEAKVQLGVMLALGQGGPKDEAAGRKLLEPLADAGNVIAQYWLGVICKLNEEYVEALEWLEKSAKGEDRDAAVIYAATLTFLSESTIARSKDQAIGFLRAGADEGHAGCQYELGWFYHQGLWVPEDPQQAVYWIKKAASQKDGRACSRLGWFYEAGRGVTRDQQEAIRWYRQGHLAGDDYSTDRLRALGVR